MGDQVLLGDYPTGQWTRVSPNQMLVPQQLLVLPTYRARIATTKGVMVKFSADRGSNCSAAVRRSRPA